MKELIKGLDKSYPELLAECVQFISDTSSTYYFIAETSNKDSVKQLYKNVPQVAGYTHRVPIDFVTVVGYIILWINIKVQSYNIPGDVFEFKNLEEFKEQLILYFARIDQFTEVKK
jgi:hypothetical protein